MKLAAKTFLIITATVALGLTSIFGVAGYVLIEDFKDIERDQMESELERVEGLIQDDLQTMEGTALGLSDLAGALLGNDTDNENETADDATALFLNLFAVQRVDHVFAYADTPNGTVTFGFSFDRATFNLTDAPVALNETLQQLAYGRGLLPGTATSGTVLVDGTGYLLAAAPLALQQSEFEASSLTIARELSAEYQAALAAVAREDVTLATPSDTPPAALEGPHLVAHSWSSMTAYLPVAGIDGEAAAVIVLQSDRTTFSGGIDTITFFFFASLLIAAIFLAAGLTTMQLLVTGRVRHLGRSMERIRHSDSLEGRVSIRGQDEVQDLAGGFNRLMDTLQEHDEALHASNRDLEGFASVASHDLKSPLSTFALNLALERRVATEHGDEDSLQRIERMENGVRSMAERVDAILAYSRSKSVDIELTAVDMGEVVREVLADLEAEVRRTGADLQVAAMPVVRGDRQQLLQIMQNLISNAIKYGKEGEAPKVRVHAERGPGAFRIHVEDRGRGFSDDDVATMLEPFRRLKNAAGRSGHGVGLATVARILERLGGTLEVHGVPDVGARFTITLPAPDRTVAQAP